ncbi:gp647 [Bacillus phage G]|uniref:Gp647 n=1 Tax=Bacillus phage G TaxID=2884420 RepID=G3MB27_9CAUD|nr:gp647 [Bacillus phage G]AEO93890.1 gp647 [Bacillus phage G]
MSKYTYDFRVEPIERLSNQLPSKEQTCQKSKKSNKTSFKEILKNSLQSTSNMI